jgi:hypothetical protein
VFPVRYELDLYIFCGINLSFKGLKLMYSIQTYLLAVPTCTSIREAGKRHFLNFMWTPSEDLCVAKLAKLVQ